MFYAVALGKSFGRTYVGTMHWCHEFYIIAHFNKSVFYFSERMYTDKHEWILTDGKTGTVGISHYAQVSLLMSRF